jgi:N-acetyl-gamma-glutamyl-phosphate reductase
MTEAGIIGGTGYVAGELIRILLQHSQVNINFVYSHSHAGQKAMAVHEDLFAHPDIVFTDQVNPEVDVVFLCLGHGNSSQFLSQYKFSDKTKIIDLSNDFRLEKDALFQGYKFEYGLTEINLDKITQAENIANPGCFATAIQLGLLPLANEQLLKDEVHIHGITGSTGAGQSLSKTTHFSWRNNNISAYKPFVHQHLDEIRQSLVACQNNFDYAINFIPLRGDFTRGIFTSIYTETDLVEDELVQLYKNFYDHKPFTMVSDTPINLKQVVNTNYCLIHVEKHGSKAYITTSIDNLLKGAAGQAIENMNLMFGFIQDEGLGFKPNYF